MILLTGATGRVGSAAAKALISAGMPFRALIRDPDGVIHRVAVGNYLGKNHGKISVIRPDQVELSEFINDGIGGWLVRDAEMALGGS